MESESGTNAVLNIGTQAALTGQPQSGSQIATAIDSISTNDVRNVSIYVFYLFAYFVSLCYFAEGTSIFKKMYYFYFKIATSNLLLQN